MVKKSENIVLDMQVGRLAKGSQAAKDFMKELRDKKGKGKVSGKGNKGSRPSAADMAGSKKKLLGAFHAEEDEEDAPKTPVGSPVQSVPAPPPVVRPNRRGRNTGGQHMPNPLAQPSTPNQRVSTSAGVPAPSSLPTDMLIVGQPATIGEALSTLENAANNTKGRGLADAKKRAHKFILDNIDKVKEADLDRIKKVFLSIKGKGIFDSIGKAFKKAGSAVAKTATSVGKTISRGTTKVAKDIGYKTEDAAYKTGDFVKSEKGLKTIGSYAVPATVGMLAGLATGGNPVASAAAGAATSAAYDKLVMGKGGLMAQEAFGEGLTGGFIQGDIELANKSRYTRIPIKTLSAKQMTSMRKGRGVRCIRAPCPDDSMNIMVDPMNTKKITKAFIKGKGITIALSPEELNCNKTEMKGEGIFGRWGDKVMDKLGVKKIAYKVGDIAKPFIKSALSKAAIAIPTALGQPELIPAAMIAANVAGKYMDRPSDFQRPAEKALNVIQGNKSIMDVAKDELPALAKSTLNDYIQRYGSQVLEQAVQAAKSNLGLVRPNDNSPFNYGTVAGNGLYGRGLTGGCCGAGLRGSGLTAGSGAFVGQGIYAGSNRVIGGQIGQHSKGMVALDHPSMRSRPELEDIARIANQYYRK